MEYAQLIKTGDRRYEFNYGNDTCGYESIPLEGSLSDIVKAIKADGWMYCSCPNETWCDIVWQMYQDDGCEAVYMRKAEEY